MISQGSQGVGRLAQLSFTCLTIHRNNLPPSSVQRVSSLLITHCGITPRNHNVYISPTCWRTYTDNPVSRPKAHTGRTSGKPKKPAKPPSTKEPKKTGASQAKRRPKSESRTKSSSKTKTTRRAKAKAKPKRKSKPRSRTKKVLTDDQKARLARRIEIQKHKTEVQKRKELKTTMLKPPKPLPASAWTVFVIEYFEKAAGTKVELGAMMRNAGSEFRQLTPERLEHYNHSANQNKAANTRAQREFVESYTPEQIRLANIARKALRNKGEKRVRLIRDERQVAVPRNPYMFYYLDRQRSGDFKGIGIGDSGRLAGSEWKTLTALEKKEYLDLAALDHQRYIQESKTVLNRDIPIKRASAAPAAAAA